MNRFVIASAALLAVLPSLQAKASDPSACLSLANVVASAGTARDRGVPLSQVLAIVNNTAPGDRTVQAVLPSLRRTIVLLYQHPSIDAKTAGQTFYAGCVR
jgi:hypothetical protein